VGALASAAITTGTSRLNRSESQLHGGVGTRHGARHGGQGSAGPRYDHIILTQTAFGAGVSLPGMQQSHTVRRCHRRIDSKYRGKAVAKLNDGTSVWCAQTC
jgi:hypothetical protein